MKSLDQIHHIAITVNDLDKAVNWYLTSFACEKISHSKLEAVLQFANIRLSLVMPSSQPGHVAFIRNDADTFGVLRKQHDGTLSCYLSDSSGNVVEVVSASGI